LAFSHPTRLDLLLIYSVFLIEFLLNPDEIEAMLLEICGTFSGLLDSMLIGRASRGESKVSYLKLRTDFLRYFAEFTDGNARSKAAACAHAASAETEATAEMDLAFSHPIRLGLLSIYTVFMYEVLLYPDEIEAVRKKLCDTFSGQLDSLLIRKASRGEVKVVYPKMTADTFDFIAEFPRRQRQEQGRSKRLCSVRRCLAQ